MDHNNKLLLLTILLLLLFSISFSFSFSSPTNMIKKTYIIHMAKSQMPNTFVEHQHWYEASLTSISSSAEMLYTYDTVIHGFSARLSPAEAKALEETPGVLAVLPETRYELHTTRTPEFLGLDKTEGLVPASGTETDVVVGVLDTGVWPERSSFNDAGFGPVPAGWKGACEQGTNFSTAACNRKLIGARFFCKGYEASMGPVDETKESRSPRDDDGHGTHTSSTAAGSAVPSASLLGYAAGNARGMAVRARLAVYKVCWGGGCFSSDILAAMERAVDDGCHVLSLSLGGGMSDYYRDSVAIGAFTAMEKGVLVSCSAGNAGPSSNTLSNVAPWITTVGAGTLDRDFPAYVSLGNRKNYSGVSLYSGKPLPDSPLPFVYAGNVSNSTNGNLCMPGTLIPSLVAGKLVLCDRGINARVQKGYVVREAGGAGMILANTAANGEELVADAHLLPATGVGEKAASSIRSYMQSDPNPTATIVFSGTKVNIQPSPVVAAFSSRGPNSITPEILKPDLIAPGVNILAGWTGAVGPTGLTVDPRRVEFNIISGTSMSCPHVSGLAALLKGAHPDWSPAAIKSALMTTAYDVYSGGDGILDIATGKPASPFDYGAGHVDPPRALDPGLVYDLTVEDYLDFLCALNYTALQIASLSKRSDFKCSGERTYAVSGFNYPSFSVAFTTASGSSTATTTVTHVRTVTNVGPVGTYKVSVMTSEGDGGAVKVVVDPSELDFKTVGEKRSYKVTFTAGSMPSGSVGFGRLEWTDGKHVVASPMAFTWT
ncbi:subtilisin-like protease SBT1.7 [Dioscorea cayenensis subsp. rotundata]|uniref:Subtilisin-like protease SBT1.7 n=1 Tax=Dioscorea cayennensis subsp. rotundata TaxID=55577 RepID=A0AB40CIJ9_DIOCR|nr:subtilisin-like protease SBT1.7 [Dioscorea cayenensis subsp. rotundata]